MVQAIRFAGAKDGLPQMQRSLHWGPVQWSSGWYCLVLSHLSQHHKHQKRKLFWKIAPEVVADFSLNLFMGYKSRKTRSVSVEEEMVELEMGSCSTIVNWNQFCWDVAVQYFLNHPERFGGCDTVAEIDESLFARWKYNRGHVVREQCILGG